MRTRLVVVAALTLGTRLASADPCGMVPPIYTGNEPPITRVGPQRTYVFFEDGVETYVIRPGFAGKVAEFGMLIPFPSVPALRKVPDTLFAQIGAAIDPPEIVIDLSPRDYDDYGSGMRSKDEAKKGAEGEAPLRLDEVKVLKSEAVGMYEVVVLAAGSAKALDVWMSEHKFQYPKGMDAVVNDYVKLGWVFVAEKTKVGSKSESDPKPGMRSVDASAAPGSKFDGYVQAMGFRFKVDKPVVPMRLSPFNPGEKRQIVYYLTKDPVKLDGMDGSLVKRQITGERLYKNVTGLLPLRVVGGTLINGALRQYRAQRDPGPHNGQAKDLFASDLAARKTKTLSLPFEEEEKELLRIGEALEMRGPEIDTLHEAELQSERGQAAVAALEELKDLELTVIDGNFSESYMKDHDLTISRYEMPKQLNSISLYDAKGDGPVKNWYANQGQLFEGEPADKDWYKSLWK